MSLIKKSYKALFNKDLDKRAKLKYSRVFKGYNANVKYGSEFMEFRLSFNWKEVSDEIKIGLIQSLLNKVYKTNIKTVNIDLYDIFLKKIPTVTPKTKSDPVLEESFNRVNDEYFNGMMIQPNLVFGGKTFRTLGTYDYGTDTIRISKLMTKDETLLDYVMYHELLHKKFQYKNTAKRTIHHSREFRAWEKKYNIPDIEKKLKSFLRKERLKNWFV